MAKKKIYAVRKGHKTGLFATWAECQKAVSGYSGAEFRGFTEKEEALAFLIWRQQEMYPVIKQKRRQESWKYLKIWSLLM